MADTVTVKGIDYEIGRIPPREQWNVVKRIMPLIGPILPAAQKAAASKASDEQVLAMMIAPLTDGLAKLSDEDSAFVFGTCLSRVKRKNSAGNFVQAWTAGGTVPMFSDSDDLMVMLTLTCHVIWENLGGFFGEVRGLFLALQVGRRTPDATSEPPTTSTGSTDPS